MRIGVLITCAGPDTQRVIDALRKSIEIYDASVVYIKTSINEIRLVEKMPEEL